MSQGIRLSPKLQKVLSSHRKCVKFILPLDCLLKGPFSPAPSRIGHVEPINVVRLCAEASNGQQIIQIQ